VNAANYAAAAGAEACVVGRIGNDPAGVGERREGCLALERMRGTFLVSASVGYQAGGAGVRP
jgi:hypothetical protein